MIHFWVVKGLPSRMAALHSAQERSDWSELASLAHQMAGAAGGNGFPTMVAAKIELQARDHVPPAVLASSISKFASLCNAAIGGSSPLH